MFLFVFSALLSVSISIFILLKFKSKKIVNRNGILVVILIATFASSFTYLIYKICQLTEEIHLCLSLGFSFLSNCLLFYLLVGNEDALKFLDGKIRIYKETSVFATQLGNLLGQFIVPRISTLPTNNEIGTVGLRDLIEAPPAIENGSIGDSDDGNIKNQSAIQIYVVPFHVN